MASSATHPVVGGTTTTPLDVGMTVTPSVIGSGAGSRMSSRVKLPEITLKRFRGDLSKWSTFWDTFESTVDKSPALSDVDKFSYLQSLLEGPAAEAISGLSLTSVNYSEAIEVLKKRFGNTQLIISKHMDTLVSFN